jgi:hypothetical protein
MLMLRKPKIDVSNFDDAQIEVEVEARQTQTKGINYTTRESSVAIVICCMYGNYDR